MMRMMHNNNNNHRWVLWEGLWKGLWEGLWASVLGESVNEIAKEERSLEKNRSAGRSPSVCLWYKSYCQWCLALALGAVLHGDGALSLLFNSN